MPKLIPELEALLSQPVFKSGLDIPIPVKKPGPIPAPPRTLEEEIEWNERVNEERGAATRRKMAEGLTKAVEIMKPGVDFVLATNPQARVAAEIGKAAINVASIPGSVAAEMSRTYATQDEPERATVHPFVREIGLAPSDTEAEPGNVVDALAHDAKEYAKAAARGVAESIIGEPVSFSEMLEQEGGEQMGLGEGLAVDVATDITSLPMAAASVPRKAIQFILKNHWRAARQASKVAAQGAKAAAKAEAAVRAAATAPDMSAAAKIVAEQGDEHVQKLAAAAAEEGRETRPYVERLIQRVPKRPEILGIEPTGDLKKVRGLNEGTVRRVEEEARWEAFTERMGITDPTQKAMQSRILADGGRFYDHRQITRPWSEAQDESWKRIWTRELGRTGLPKGAILNDAEMMSLERAVRGLNEFASNATDDLMKAERLADDSPQLLDLFKRYGVKTRRGLENVADQAMQEAMVGWRSLSGVRSETGRALNALKSRLHYKSISMNDEDFIRQLSDAGLDVGQARKALSTLDTPEARFDFIRKLSRPDGLQVWRWYYMTSLLSGPKTHARNLLSNTANMALQNVAYGLGRSADVVRGRLPWDDFKNEAMMMMRGQREGISKGWEQAMKIWRRGFSDADMAVWADKPAEVTLSDLGLNFGKRADDRSLKPLNAISRFLEASDQFSRTIAFSGALHAGAYAKVSRLVKAGKLRPSQFQGYVDDIIADPMHVAPDVFKDARKFAQEAVYRQDAGPVLSRVIDLVGSVDRSIADVIDNTIGKIKNKPLRMAGRVVTAPLHVGTTLMPFIKTPAGVMKRGMRVLGGGLASSRRHAKAGEHISAAVARGEAMVGALGASTLMYYALNGNITGSGPDVAVENEKGEINRAKSMDAFYANRRPNSIRIGDTWVNYQSMGPISQLLSALGNIGDSYRRNKDEGLPDANTLIGAVVPFAKSFMSNSFLTGVMGLVSAIEENEDNSTKKLIGKTATGMVPVSSFVRTARNFTDDTMRDTTGQDIVGSIENNLRGLFPVLSKELPARVDLAGKQIKTPGIGPDVVKSVMRTVSPVDLAPVEKDLVRNELAKLGAEAYLVAPSKKLTDDLGNPMDLSGVETTELQERIGNAQYNVAAAMIFEPSFRELHPDLKAEMLKTLMSAARSTAKKEYRDELRKRTIARAR